MSDVRSTHERPVPEVIQVCVDKPRIVVVHSVLASPLDMGAFDRAGTRVLILVTYNRVTQVPPQTRQALRGGDDAL